MIDLTSAANRLRLMNNADLTSHLTNVQRALVLHMTGVLARNGVKMEDEPEVPRERRVRDETRFLLNSVGPAAAWAAMEFALKDSNVRNSLGVVDGLVPRFNGDQIRNAKLILNDDSNVPIGALTDFTGVLRQFLLPRYAYIDFDMLVDPRHRIDMECGYPKFITPIMYRYMYDRDDMACRVNDIYPDESWAMDPDIYEDENEDVTTPFEEDWQQLCDEQNMLSMLYRMDKLCGIGHYGVLLLGLDDGKDLEDPVDEPELLLGQRGTVGTKQRKLLYMRPFDEYLSFIMRYETDTNSPRYGQPIIYNLVFVDMSIDAAGASIGTRLNRRVHWSRVVHISDNLMSSGVMGIPRQQQVFNRLLDLRKIKGSSGEMFYKGAWPGLSFEVDPRIAADEPDFDKEEFKKEVMAYASGLSRSMTLVGISAKSLAAQVADPKSHVRIQEEAIAMKMNIPFRIFKGSEEGRLASGQDKLTWNIRLKRRLKRFVQPSMIRPVVDRLVALGCMRPAKKNKYFTDWPDLNTPTDDDKANLALKWTQALSQYVATGMIHLMQPMDFLTIIIGLPPSLAKRVIETAKADGSWDKLLKVDPSQGAGQNGVRENIAGKAGDSKGSEGNARNKPAKRETADKKQEGKAP